MRHDAKPRIGTFTVGDVYQCGDAAEAGALVVSARACGYVATASGAEVRVTGERPLPPGRHWEPLLRRLRALPARRTLPWNPPVKLQATDIEHFRAILHREMPERQFTIKSSYDREHPEFLRRSFRWAKRG